MDNRVTLQIRAAASLLVSMLLTAEEERLGKLPAKVSKVWGGFIGNGAAKHAGCKVEDT